MATLAERVAQLEAQQALQTAALRRILEGRWTSQDGLVGADGIVLALEGGLEGGAAPLAVREPLYAAPEAPYRPTVEDVAGNVAGTFVGQPRGVILHGTRSTKPYDVEEEYAGTVTYVRNGAGGLGWNVTIGDDRLARHLAPDQWGWNAREHSREYLAAEFAQATVDGEVTDGQVRAFAWWWKFEVLKRWPRLPLVLPTHASLPAGARDGKTDVFPNGDPRVDRLVQRIRAAVL